MRKIMFRGKNSIGDWWYGNLITREYIKDGQTKHLYEISDITTSNFCTGIIPETVGQFTGLTDKNGKEVFEGDICNCNYGYTSDKIGVVYYEDGCFYVDDKHPSGNMPLKTLVKNEGNRIEVIGNIHDNPELLK